MTTPILVNLAFEDLLSEGVMRRILTWSARPYSVQTCFSQGGAGYLQQRVCGFNNAARGIPFFLLTDLDTETCAPSLIRKWIPREVHPNLIFRVAVREVESWLMADRANLARFLGVQIDLVPQNPEAILDPKREIIKLALHSRHNERRRDIVPRTGSTSKQGPNYNGRLLDFVNRSWDLDDAAEWSASLRGTLDAIKRFIPSTIDAPH